MQPGGTIQTLIVLAGIGHLALAVGSLAIPKTMGWREDTAKLKLLTRQVVWTYAGYIWFSHVAFGLLVRLLIGTGLVVAAWIVWIFTRSRVIATALILPGLRLMLHFGLFNLLAGGWRYLGVDAVSLFKAPLLSRSLTEFWGRRWNLAFSEMTAAGIYRPISRVTEKPAGIVAPFVGSGILHELAISLPVKAGFGLPLLYFALHGGLMLIEKALDKRGRAVSTHEAFGRIWVFFWLVAPLPVLFHPPFLNGVVWPILGMQR